jgi:hypothetical protein
MCGGFWKVTDEEKQWQKLDGTSAESDAPIDWTTNPFLEARRQMGMSPEQFAQEYLQQWPSVPKDEHEAKKLLANRNSK